MRYEAIVIGGGAAGLTAAAYLCQSGHQVLLCEQSTKTGGLVQSFTDRDFTFDAGIRAFENCGIILPMLRQLGIDLNLVANPVSIGIGDQLIHLRSRNSLADYEQLLLAFFPSERQAIHRIMQEIKMVIGTMDVIYGIDNPLFMDIGGDRDYLLKTLLPWLWQYQKKMRQVSRLLQPVNTYLRQFTDNQALIDMITQHFFADTPTFFALSYFGLYLDYSYPQGGTGVLAEKLNAFIRERKGIILTQTKITAIDTEQKQIQSSDGRTFTYQQLLWAGDSKRLYQAITPAKRPLSANVSRQKARVDRHTGGDSILTVFLAAGMDPATISVRCGPHCFYTPAPAGLSAAGLRQFPDQGSRADRIRQIKDYLAATTYEIACPALRDPALAPQGQTGLIVSTLMSYDLVREIEAAGWYEDFKTLCTKTIIRILDATLLSGLQDQILFDRCATPLTIESETGNSGGAITGWALGSDALPAETNLKKIRRSVLTPIPDVYQAGQWTFSPSGLPISILTGKLAANKISRALRRQRH